LHFEIGLDRVAAGRPFVDCVPNDGVAVAVEDVVGTAWNRGRTVARLGAQPRQAGAVAAALVDVAAGMSEQAVRAEPNMRRAAGREGVAAEQFAAELDELPGRREPPKLYAIIVVLIVDEDPVGQRLIGKVPGMRMLLVELADAGEEATSPQGQTPGQARRLQERFFDRQVVFRVDRQR